MSSSYFKEMEVASMEAQPPRGKQTGRSSDSGQSPMNLDNVSTTTTTGGDVPTVESLRNPIDPRRSSRDGSELASPTSTNTDPSLSDKLQGKAQKIAGKVSRNTELYEKGEIRESGK